MRAAHGRRSYVELPPGWERVHANTTGPFVTAETLRRPDGSTVTWSSRAHRKAHPRTGVATNIWWQPRRRGWWMALLFAVGSLCFLVAALAAQAQSQPGSWVGATFFAGSLAFTSAAYLQYCEVVNVDHGPLRLGSRERFKPATWEPGRIDWLAGAVQLAGTLFFNVSTFAAMQDGFTTQQINHRVWAPDMFGSICFLIASELAFAEVCHRWTCLRGRSLSWRIVALNLAGSIAFGISALASLVDPSTDEVVNATISNVGTALGALGFLVGAILLIPESSHADTITADAGAAVAAA